MMARVPDDDVVPAPASPVTSDRASALPAVPAVQPVTVGAAVATGLVLLVAATIGYAAVLGTTLVLALVLAWCWPVLGGSVTPRATAVVLALSALAIVPAARA